MNSAYLVEITGAAFSSIVAATLSASVLASIVIVMQWVFRRKLTASWRFALWIPVSLRLLVPVLPESQLSMFNVPNWFQDAQGSASDLYSKSIELPDHPDLQSSLSGLDESALPSPAAQPLNRKEGRAGAPVRRPFTTKEMLAGGWCLVSALLLARLVLGQMWLGARLRKHRTVPDPKLIRVIARARSDLRTFWKPELVETSLVESPGLIGCFFPKLLLPVRSPQASLSDRELRHIFLHELAHLKRGDLFLNWGMALAAALHWFNPVVWYVLRRMRLERELACDSIVLQTSDPAEAHAYGETILKLLQGQGRRAASSALVTPAMVGILEEKEAAQMRLRQIAEYRPKRTSGWKTGIPLLLAFALTGLSNAQTDQSKAAGDTGGGHGPAEIARTDPDAAAKSAAQDFRTEYDLQAARVKKAQAELDDLGRRLKAITD
jgi:bla regulator protein BlaR1